MQITYIWDNNCCLDDIISGWIPSYIVNVLKNHQKSGGFKIILHNR